MQVGKPVGALKEIGETKKKGSKITFLADDSIFDEVDFQYDVIRRRLRSLHF